MGDIPMQRNLLENLFQAAARYPDKTAVIDETSSITYYELAESVADIGDALARNFARRRAQKSVLIFIDKSIDCLKAMLGVLYCGQFYVVMDEATPADRFQEIVSVAENCWLITIPEELERIAQLGYKGQILLVEDLETLGREDRAEGSGREAESYFDSVDAPWRQRIDTDLAYVLFTSGSTGVPKGVAVSHRSVLDYVDAYVGAVGIEPDDVLGNQSPFFFDVSLKDIYMAQKVGATLCIVPTKYFMTPKKLLQFLEDYAVTVIAWVPTAYRLIAQFHGLQKVRPSHLRKFVFSGESMPTFVYHYWKQEYPDAIFIQQYGPTEITGACVNYEVTRDFADEETIPIGRAFDNTDLFLVDDKDGYIAPEETGRVGEILVRGSCLAAGYYNNPEKTKEAFVQNPLNRSYPEIVYRTSDLAYWNERKELVFVSRKDFQIKHSGHRIELGEIEAGLLAIEGVEGCCCVQNRREDEIVCFYVGGSVGKKEIMLGAQKKLPKYMIPSVYHQLEMLPTLPNGKTDRKALDRQANEGSES